MSRAELISSRTLWLGREKKAARHYHWYRDKSKRPAAEAKKLEEKWLAAYREARDNRKRRDAQISKLSVSQVDAAGLRFIKEAEGMRTHPYNDSAGHATIGVGHLIHLGPVTAADKRKYARFNERDALMLLDRDLDSREAVVAKVAKQSKVPFNQSMFNACVSFTFNIGNGGWASSTVAKELKAGRKQAAADAMLKWNKPPEIMGRRRKERSLFLS